MTASSLAPSCAHEPLGNAPSLRLVGLVVIQPNPHRAGGIQHSCKFRKRIEEGRSSSP